MAGFLEDRHEHLGVDDAADGMVPSEQCLGAGHPASTQFEDRLEDEGELAAVQCAAEVHVELHAFGDRVAHLRREHDETVLAVGLGAVQRDVGVAQELAGRGPIADGDADAGGDGDRGVVIALDLERLAQDVEDAFGDQLRPGVEAGTFDQHDELVAAQPTDGIAVAQHGGQSHRDRLEQLVAGTVPERVVDVLETVEVDEQRGGRHVVASCPGQHRVDPVEDEHAVGETGQRVVERLMPDAFQQPGIADGGGGLTRQREQATGEVGISPQPFGIVRDRRHDAADGRRRWR